MGNFYAGVKDANGILHSVRGVDTFVEERGLHELISNELGEGWNWLQEPSPSNPLDERDERIGDNLPPFVP